MWFAVLPLASNGSLSSSPCPLVSPGGAEVIAALFEQGEDTTDVNPRSNESHNLDYRHGKAASRIWNVHTGTEVARMEGHEGAIWCLVLSHDGDRIVTGSEDHTCRVWDAASGVELVTIAEHTGPVWSVAWSPDDKAVKAISDKAYEVALEHIRNNRAAMDKIVEVLLEKETLTGDEFREILSQYTEIPAENRQSDKQAAPVAV